jgi:catechol 1,2-dioxygenase
MSIETPRAADSGASATARFRSDKSAYDAVKDTPKERVDQLARETLAAIHGVIRKHRLTYDEYQAWKAWLIDVGETGEWPLFLDVFVEHVVEEVNTDHRQGSKGTIEGPYYVPGAPVIAEGGVGHLPTRSDEPGQRLVWTGVVRDTDGSTLDDAAVEVWTADDAGYYSQFAPGIPEWNLRGTVPVGSGGTFELHMIKPAPYQIPTDGACGRLLAAAGWHPWRPAHIHVKVSAPGHELLTAQLYFPSDAHNDDDVAQAVKPDLVLDTHDGPDGGLSVEYGFVLDPIR